MDKEYENFDIELKALLIKYNMSLQPVMNINIVKNPLSEPQGTKPMETSEVTGTDLPKETEVV